MFTVITGALIGLFASLAFNKKTNGSRDIYIFVGLFSLVMAGFGSALLALTVIVRIAPVVWVDVAQYELAGMRTVDETQGVFALGSGLVEGVSAYRVMLRNEDDSMTPSTVPAGANTRITEDPQLKGRGYLIIRTLAVDPSWQWKNWVLSKPQPLHYDLRVPPGTVRTSFSAQ